MKQSQQDASKIIVTLLGLGGVCLLAMLLLVLDIDFAGIIDSTVGKSIDEELSKEFSKLAGGRKLPIPVRPR